MNTKQRRRMWFAWQTARFFSRMLTEHVASGWLLGSAPFLAHLGAAVSRTDYRWIPADVYLFVMMIGGSVAIDAFKDRRSDGPIRPLAGMLGSLVAGGAAWCYGSLETDIQALHDFLRSNFPWAIGIALGIDLWYRVPNMILGAMQEAFGKESLPQ